jgi:hypothetical protein
MLSKDAVTHPGLVRAKQLLQRERAKLQQATKAALDAYQPKTVVDAQRLADQLEGVVASNGHANLARFNEALEFLEKEKGLKFGFTQKQLINVARLILLKRMFGTGLPAALIELQLKYAFKELYEQAAVTLPRRSGKTVVQTVLAAVIAVTQPEGNVCCFNLGGRQAKEWLAQAIGIMRLFRGSKFDWRLVNIESKEYISIVNCTGTAAKVSSYPGPKDADASNFRGMGTKLMLLLYDEFYFFKEVVWSTTLPLAKLGAPILMISSMSKTYDDAVRRMIYHKLDNGENLFLLFDWMRACPDCVARGQANTCDHIENRPQHFEPRGSLRRMRGLMQHFGNESFERELMNTAAASNRLPVFLPEWLAPLRNRANDFAPLMERAYPEFFIGVDPAGKGFSRTAVVSVLFDPVNPPPGVSYRVVVLSVETLPRTITNQDLGEWIVRHAQRLRATVRGLRHSTAVVCLENNSILVADSVKAAIRSTPGAINMGIMHENAKTAKRGTGGLSEMDVRAGTHTSNSSKEANIVKMRTLLVEQALQFHKEFFIPHPEQQPVGEGIEVARELFVDELAAICAEICKSTGPIASQRRPHIKYRGYKTNGEKANDDKVWSFSFCLTCYPLYRLSPHLFVLTVANAAHASGGRW